MKPHVTARQASFASGRRPGRGRLQTALPLEAAPAAAASGVGEIFLPRGYEPGYDYPLLVWLPAADEHRFDLGRTMARLSLRNYLAVRADVSDEAEGCFRAIDHMVERYSVHHRRIYLIGTGSGGTAAFRLACQHADAFAGVISLGGRFPIDEGLLGRLGAVRRLPMLLCCGTAAAAANGPLAADVDRTLRLFHAAGGLFGLRLYPQAGGPSWRPAVNRAVLHDVDRWIMDEVCRVPAAEPAATV